MVLAKLFFSIVKIKSLIKFLGPDEFFKKKLSLSNKVFLIKLFVLTLLILEYKNVHGIKGENHSISIYEC